MQSPLKPRLKKSSEVASEIRAVMAERRRQMREKFEALPEHLQEAMRDRYARHFPGGLSRKPEELRTDEDYARMAAAALKRAERAKKRASPAS